MPPHCGGEREWYVPRRLADRPATLQLPDGKWLVRKIRVWRISSGPHGHRAVAWATHAIGRRARQATSPPRAPRTHWHLQRHMSCHRASRGLWCCMHKSQRKGLGGRFRFGSHLLECCFPMERSSRTLHRTTVGPNDQHGNRAGPARRTPERRRHRSNPGVAYVQLFRSFYSILNFLLSSFSSQLLLRLGRGTVRKQNVYRYEHSNNVL